MLWMLAGSVSYLGLSHPSGMQHVCKETAYSNLIPISRTAVCHCYEAFSHILHDYILNLSI